MEVNQNAIMATAYSFAYIISFFLLKFILYDHGFSFANILLIIGIIYTRFYLLDNETYRIQETALIILFILFDKDLLDIGNVLLLVGIACVREQSNKDLMQKEIITFACGLTCLVMNWFSVGRVIVIHFLILFYYYTIALVLSIVFCISLWNIVIGSLERKLKQSIKCINTNAVKIQSEINKKE